MIQIKCTKKLTATNIKYILVIYDLLKDGVNQVRSIDIAKQLHLSRPSVHVMLNALSEMSIIVKDPKGMIKFSADGYILACRYRKYYDAWQYHLNKVVSDSERRKSAICAMITEFSDEENERISKEP